MKKRQAKNLLKKTKTMKPSNSFDIAFELIFIRASPKCSSGKTGNLL